MEKSPVDPSSLKVTTNSDPTSGEPLPVSGPSDLEPMVHQDPQPDASNPELTPETNQGVSQLVCVSGQSNLMMTPDPVDPQPGPSCLRGPPSYNMIRTTDPGEPETSSVSGPFIPELLAHEDLTDHQPGASNLELAHGNNLVDSQPVYVSGQSRPDPESMPGPSNVHKELRPVPGPSGFSPSSGSFLHLYDVEAVLGQGGFGTVHQGTRRSDGQKVAIKFITKSLHDRFIFIPGSTKPLFVEVGLNLVLREAPRSPYIVQMYEWFEQRYRYILIMELPHPCETLLNFTMSKRGSLDERVARRLFHQVVLAAKHCIERGVFHRDIKADNILVNTKTLQLKLIDFGCGELFDTFKEHTESQRIAVSSTVKSLGVLLFRVVNGINFFNIQMIPNSSTSSECCDLINRCKSNSLTLDEILEHEWFTKGSKKKENRSPKSASSTKPKKGR